MGRVDGKVAIVTGGTSGIGEAAARALAAEGATVLLTGRNTEAGERIAEEIRAAGDAGEFVEQDVGEEADWERVIARAVDAHGGLHVLVNNAGIGGARKLTDTTLEQWRATMRVNLDGTFLGIKHAIPAMCASGGGSIVNVSSMDGMMGAPLRVPYCASKGGMRLLTKGAALECAQLGEPVRVNSIHPGPITTNIFTAAFDHSDPELFTGTAERIFDYYTHHTPLGRFGTSEEVAAAILFFASDESSFITGAELAIDGGWTAGKCIPGWGAKAD